MNPKHFLLAIGTISLFALIWNGVVHVVILADANAALNVFARPPADRSMALSVAITVAIAVLFVLKLCAVRAPR